jgi:hypothetical protein
VDEYGYDGIRFKTGTTLGSPMRSIPSRSRRQARGIQMAEPGEGWSWCYSDEIEVFLT